MQAALPFPVLALEQQEAPIARLPQLLRSRPFRIVLLIAIGWVLGLTDLAMTLTYLMNVGMFEGNPLARWVIAMGSPAIVAAFKLTTMIISSSILFWQRRRWQAEIGAILAVIVLGQLTFQWFGYIDMSSDMTHAITIVAADPAQSDGLWATLR
ncbi:MAG: DUF5658 family protein [Phycisphaerales bacterium JB058]